MMMKGKIETYREKPALFLIRNQTRTKEMRSQ
jgi:hypothetical protein